MTQPYTDTDVELVAERLHKLDERMWSPQHRVTWREETADGQAAYRATAVEVVSALAAAGRLTPADAETRTVYKYVLTYPDGTRKDRLVDSLAVARAVAESPANWLPPGPPGEVYVRDITTFAGPWLPADTEEDTP